MVQKLSGISETKEKIKKLLDIMDAQSLLDLYIKLTTNHSHTFSKLAFKNNYICDVYGELKVLEELSYEEQIMLWDLIFYLPNDILTKVDRGFNGFQSRNTSSISRS